MQQMALASIGLPTRRLSVEGTKRTNVKTRLYTHVSRLYIRFSLPGPAAFPLGEGGWLEWGWSGGSGGGGGVACASRVPRQASGVALGGDDLQRPVLLVHGELARAMHHEEQQRAYSGHDHCKYGHSKYVPSKYSHSKYSAPTVDMVWKKK